MKTDAYLRSYIAQFFLHREIFQTKVVQKIKTRILCSITFFFFRKSCLLRDNAEKYGRARQVTYDNKIRSMRIACWIDMAPDTPSEYLILNAFFSTEIMVT